MTMTKEKKIELVKGSRIHDKDTGSSEVQVTLLTERINYLTEHVKTHKKDHHSEHGLKKLVANRKVLLQYLMKHNLERYKAIIKKLNLRK
jgi:small subunit ribosomal protein S15